MPEKKRKREMKVIDSMNPAFIKRRNNMDELILVAVFWNSPYCVADE